MTRKDFECLPVGQKVFVVNDAGDIKTDHIYMAIDTDGNDVKKLKNASGDYEYSRVHLDYFEALKCSLHVLSNKINDVKISIQDVVDARLFERQMGEKLNVVACMFRIVNYEHEEKSRLISPWIPGWCMSGKLIASGDDRFYYVGDLDNRNYKVKLQDVMISEDKKGEIT